MITAKEAREKNDKVLANQFLIEQKDLEYVINAAVKEGYSCCGINFKISQATISWLEDLGYSYKLSNMHIFNSDGLEIGLLAIITW